MEVIIAVFLGLCLAGVGAVAYKSYSNDFKSDEKETEAEEK